MPLEKKPNKLESKKSFYKTIENHYKPIVNDKIPKSILSDLCLYLAHSLHKSYKILRKKHPKSKDRYSTFKTKDLQYPFTQYIITDFLKEKDAVNYRTYSKIIFQMTENEFKDYEKQKHAYETK
ncbi:MULTISPECIES: hypothetical protein [unclassified Cellulophaga]|uniref:hypothetical protein n=1 Tax=unclassified Cellulophaga TaxID=2634405 RepID=UPI0026E33174|nr:MULTISPECIES: hypothetical protein [unclassified Cellulophaga]MDO6489836.1 hypothetical protein [Cellulophaga sp. 2_MG-2023]MDO6494970.1 hypothetical protein [Cellulophaga sp. 3_MG-2023]